MQDILNEYSGLKLREKRENALLTQKELAKELGVSDLSISLWENSKMVPSKKHLRKMLQFFSKQRR